MLVWMYKESGKITAGDVFLAFGSCLFAIPPFLAIFILIEKYGEKTIHKAKK